MAWTNPVVFAKPLTRKATIKNKIITSATHYLTESGWAELNIMVKVMGKVGASNTVIKVF